MWSICLKWQVTTALCCTKHKWSLRKISNTALVFIWNFDILFIMGFFINFEFLKYCSPSCLSDCGTFEWPWVGGSTLPPGPVAPLFHFNTSGQQDSQKCRVELRPLFTKRNKKLLCQFWKRSFRVVRAYRLMCTMVKAAGQRGGPFPSAIRSLHVVTS